MLMERKMSTTRRKVKGHPVIPPPSPKIINLPRRHRYTSRRKKPRNAVKKQPTSTSVHNHKGKLGSLFGEEREFTGAPVVLLNSGDRRERVAEEEVVEEDGVGGLAEERWRFQAEILRAECNFLRMERKFVFEKLERNRVQMERTLQSALQTLASGRKKIYGAKNMEVVLEEEIKELSEKLEELQSSYNGIEDQELRKCKNFDTKASHLRRRFELLGWLSDERCNNETTVQVHEASVAIKSKSGVAKEHLSPGCKSETKSNDVEMLKRKMEGLTKGMMDRMNEEYGSIVSTTANSLNASSASTSKRINFPDQSSFSNRHSNRAKEPSTPHEESGKCPGRCKVLVRRMVEQVRAETEQWSQMQEMLRQLRHEMEELQSSRDFWETQALSSAHEIESLKSSVQEWKKKAIKSETKANELQTEVSLVKGNLEKLKKDQIKELASTPKKTAIISLGRRLEKEQQLVLTRQANGDCDSSNYRSEIKEVEETRTARESQPLSLGKQLAREKRIMISRLKENRLQGDKDILMIEGRRKGNNVGFVRLPFKDFGNSSASTILERQNSNAIFPLHCSEPAKMEGSY